MWLIYRSRWKNFLETENFTSEKERILEMVKAPYYDKNGLKKGAWSPEEDNKLRAYVERYGHWNWRQIPKFSGMKFNSIFCSFVLSKFPNCEIPDRCGLCICNLINLSYIN